MKTWAIIFSAVGAIAAVILKFWNRNPKSDVSSKIKKALEIREEVNEQTNRSLIKLQNRKLDDLQRDLDNVVGKLDAVLYPRKPDPPAK